MTTEADTNASFFHALSDLWTRFFKDSDQLQAMYRGTEVLIGQVYLELMANVLNLSMREVPVFRREYFKLLTVREDNVYVRDQDGKYTIELTDDGIVGFNFLYNKLFDPTVILENNIDFEVDTTGDKDELAFSANPFDWDGAGNSIQGIPYRSVDVLNADESVSTYKELAFWIPEVNVDTYDMYLNFGHLISRFEPSSEAYRALLQGVTQYFVLGPTRQNLTSALNAILGIPLIRDDDEILQSVDTSGVVNNLVITDRTTYKIPVDIPIREDILDEDNWTVLTFQALEHISSFISVGDYISDPGWWYGKYIPETLLPEEEKMRRRISPQLVENLADVPQGLVHCGDPGLFCGADFTGEEPPGSPSREALRHEYGYEIFERFLKFHAFLVEFDVEAVMTGVVPFERLDTDLTEIVLAGRSAYTYLYVEPGLVFEDSVGISDAAVTLAVGNNPESLVAGKSNEIICGDTSLVAGSYYWYTGAGIGVDNLVDTPPTPNPTTGDLPNAAGEVWCVCGGADPTTLQSNDGDADFMDWPVNIKVT
jgi:hypothetical protein